MKSLKVVLFSLLTLITSTSQAAFITTQEAALDSIFSQPNFGSNPIDIVIGAASEIVAPNLLDITSNAEVSSLFGMHVGAANIVNFYFVDSISACGSTISPNIVGCGETPGNDFVVESTWAANPTWGAELLAHELGHNLGLLHTLPSSAQIQDVVYSPFLMDPSLNGSTTITTAEVSTILQSPLVQTNANGGLFIQINPVLIVASATPSIPTPATLILMLTAIGLLTRQRAKH